MAGDGKKKIGALAGRRRRNVRILMSLVAVLIVAVAALTIVLVQKDTSTAANGATTTSAEPSPVTATPQVAPVPDDAPMPTPAALGAVLAPLVSNPALGAFTGVVADARTGTTLWSQNPDTPMTPASTAKILTAAAAMLSLSPDHRVETRVVQGSRPGELVLVGGGDPTLTAQPVGQPSYYPGAPRIADLVEQIRRAGAEVDSIVVDISAYAGPTMAQGWMPEDVAAGYIAPIESVMIDGARSDPFAEEPPRSATPALDAGRVLAQALGIDLARVTVGKAESGAAPVASVLSAPLRDRLGQMMRRSDNVLAETIAREVAVAKNSEASFTGATEAIGKTLYDAGFKTDGLTLHDGSGLSVDDRVPARLQADILTAAAGETKPQLRPMLDDLPVAGATGTLSDRYASGDRTGAGWVRAKTGTLSVASALTGYVVDVDGRVLTFALMSNDRPPEVSRPALDAVAGALRLCGCR
ncbi:D-alanyl-D-alanine carboxypeptidase/D-alanyl-D-alanine-endopeptidase [Prescottella equi]|uniref:D-alanyl-D-alanine carboxypeptidase/D-alanyl-D-alanine-endopeptidase n=1 Tax=Rhodococcus hoagii TaxID=43767 RepID=A0A9Q2P4B5_RHOHA|nr:D-alanyl-D-alanine carboxypeptidase/D-alanyl-D-alanine-endopeptidase [Prescottella equi]MBM4489901.1 D-alanyl-D-alanine carboxypeptidase/D-alanyl-D-alanine-endopeptidase [Prescottella equi]MBM4500980.1 D-alanyl-D-alanine carboxypeptidase/D-alanyl-D-alanine-endopeptidase [Prescottella equi]MBM4502702.1 D-alanyl-D-alanine carboxypeptidase/D-alanyl-D-alanine-endopeptidase [Prescottella equi]MBM4548324.1 D-alanyl-D-alanine carboxypeptidase/D-alanyl-D-alanine-endopeptidase [Prescottella equi]MBM